MEMNGNDQGKLNFFSFGRWKTMPRATSHGVDFQPVKGVVGVRSSSRLIAQGADQRAPRARERRHVQLPAVPHQESRRLC